MTKIALLCFIGSGVAFLVMGLFIYDLKKSYIAIKTIHKRNKYNI